MRNNLPPPAPKGTRTPGSGRKLGTPNRVTVAFHALIGQMVDDPLYQHKLRQDFRARKVHPTVEALVWAYHVGKPKTEIEISGGLELSRRMDDDREKLRALDLGELEALAAASQALVDQAFDRAISGRLLGAQPQDIAVEALPDKDSAETLDNWAGSDKEDSVTCPAPSIDQPASDGNNAG